ncbi:uncharacterized protein C8R40DRAFT_498743 [Lentinula edodes]|uniref:uncharacterized protein n=1 Tax=Lentinula edodes TaxID=5353 RepID=UPI001E8E435B|nr:uncharacterized protein C8R40DRAFT_498743 [Lentinula edodes]KAH7872383.1 hypothetical protein C8R40DRAFT_498743 [Lentinula edodes]
MLGKRGIGKYGLKRVPAFANSCAKDGMQTSNYGISRICPLFTRENVHFLMSSILEPLIVASPKFRLFRPPLTRSKLERWIYAAGPRRLLAMIIDALCCVKNAGVRAMSKIFTLLLTRITTEHLLSQYSSSEFQRISAKHDSGLLTLPMGKMELVHLEHCFTLKMTRTCTYLWRRAGCTAKVVGFSVMRRCIHLYSLTMPCTPGVYPLSGQTSWLFLNGIRKLMIKTTKFTFNNASHHRCF